MQRGEGVWIHVSYTEFQLFISASFPPFISRDNRLAHPLLTLRGVVAFNHTVLLAPLPPGFLALTLLGSEWAAERTRQRPHLLRTCPLPGGQIWAPLGTVPSGVKAVTGKALMSVGMLREDRSATDLLDMDQGGLVGDGGAGVRGTGSRTRFMARLPARAGRWAPRRKRGTCQRTGCSAG